MLVYPPEGRRNQSLAGAQATATCVKRFRKLSILESFEAAVGLVTLDTTIQHARHLHSALRTTHQFLEQALHDVQPLYKSLYKISSISLSLLRNPRSFKDLNDFLLHLPLLLQVLFSFNQLPPQSELGLHFLVLDC